MDTNFFVVGLVLGFLFWAAVFGASPVLGFLVALLAVGLGVLLFKKTEQKSRGMVVAACGVGALLLGGISMSMVALQESVARQQAAEQRMAEPAPATESEGRNDQDEPPPTMERERPDNQDEPQVSTEGVRPDDPGEQPLTTEGEGQNEAEDAVLSSLREQAERGDADSQFWLGFRYAAGRGVPRDDEEAVRWLRAAAEQGEVDSQILLGGMYKDGKGVPQDYVRAHMWYDLAASAGEESAPERRDEIAEEMTSEQIAEAQRLAREWKPKTGGQ